MKAGIIPTNFESSWFGIIDRLRENRSQLSSKCYVIYAIILELIQASTDEAQPKGAIRFGQLMQELKKDKLCYRLFSGDLEEIKMLCSPLCELNLLVCYYCLEMKATTTILGLFLIATISWLK